jgi:tRNA(Phe) wybutosine-synthesizing methylase Tyw3
LKDIYEVLRKKQAQQAQLAQQIEALQVAAKDLEAVQHLLQDDELSVGQKAGN